MHWLAWLRDRCCHAQGMAAPTQIDTIRAHATAIDERVLVLLTAAGGVDGCDECEKRDEQ